MLQVFIEQLEIIMAQRRRAQRATVPRAHPASLQYCMVGTYTVPYAPQSNQQMYIYYKLYIYKLIHIQMHVHHLLSQVIECSLRQPIMLANVYSSHTYISLYIHKLAIINTCSNLRESVGNPFNWSLVQFNSIYNSREFVAKSCYLAAHNCTKQHLCLSKISLVFGHAFL